MPKEKLQKILCRMQTASIILDMYDNDSLKDIYRKKVKGHFCF